MKMEKDMETVDYEKLVQELREENARLVEENEHMKRLMESYYQSRRTYYEKNKAMINQKARERMRRIAEEYPERIRQYRKNAYLKRKHRENSNANIEL